MPTTAPAQEAPRDTINVIGRKPNDVRNEAQQFVRSIGVGVQPVARWLEPICPKVFGVTPEIGKRVADAVRETARQSGAPVAKTPAGPTSSSASPTTAAGLRADRRESSVATGRGPS